MMQVGIIGFGAFGQLLARVLSEHVEVLAYDKEVKSARTDKIVMSDLQTVASAPLIIIATDLAGIEPVCRQLEPLVSSQAIVMDVCSVKDKPQEIMQQVLGNTCRVLATHPLFGPQSVAENGGVQGLEMVVCGTDSNNTTEIQDIFAEKLGIKFLRMTAQEHDQEMAWVHGLTFFVGRALMNLSPPKSELTTHYYQKLLDLVGLEQQHSDALFMTIQRGNQYTDAVRKAYVKELRALNKQIDK